MVIPSEGLGGLEIKYTSFITGDPKTKMDEAVGDPHTNQALQRVNVDHRCMKLDSTQQRYGRSDSYQANPVYI